MLQGFTDDREEVSLADSIRSAILDFIPRPPPSRKIPSQRMGHPPLTPHRCLVHLRIPPPPNSNHKAMSEAPPTVPTFLHSHSLFKGPPPLSKSKASPWEWWAVHVPTLTPISISLHGIRLQLQWANHLIPPLHSSHPGAHATLHLDEPKLSAELAAELAACFDKPIRLVRSSPIPTDHPELPEHLPVFDLSGDSPAIWRSADPRMILPVEVTETTPGDLIDAIFGPRETLGTPLSWSEEIVIRVPGHLYYYQECEAALEEYTAELLKDAYGDGYLEEPQESTQARLEAIRAAGEGLIGPDELRKLFEGSFDFEGLYDDTPPADLPAE